MDVSNAVGQNIYLNDSGDSRANVLAFNTPPSSDDWKKIQDGDVTPDTVSSYITTILAPLSLGVLQNTSYVMGVGTILCILPPSTIGNQANSITGNFYCVLNDWMVAGDTGGSALTASPITKIGGVLSTGNGGNGIFPFGPNGPIKIPNSLLKYLAWIYLAFGLLVLLIIISFVRKKRSKRNGY